MRAAWFVVALAFPAGAWDSVCRGSGGEACTSLEGARIPFSDGEHAQIWRHSRVLSGLPAGLDEDFQVTTPIVQRELGGGISSLAPAPLDLADGQGQRSVSIPLFAQLPDFSFALWDWTAGNESCPPAGTSSGPELCHEFEGHLSWLNASHFLPQAGAVFARLHGEALATASACARMPQTVETLPLRQACDREALLIEAVAHHFLQDAWSMGHMWQRWGSPAVGDFQSQLGGASLEALAKSVGIASGIVHGAKAFSGRDDALCAPGAGIEWRGDDGVAHGAGDLFWTSVRDDGGFDEQLLQMLSCTASAQREVYLASSRSFGEAGPLSPLLVQADARGRTCLGQRATNRAMFLAAAIDLPGIDATLNAQTIEFLDEVFVINLGVDTDDALGRRLPLTAEVLAQIIVPDAASLRARWADDMSDLRNALNFSSALDPDGVSLADGGLPPLLGMLPNGAYSIDAADYFDPPVPWAPTAIELPLEPTVDNAANILARTFVDAHAVEWCGVLHRQGDDEFALDHLRDRCRDARAADDDVADVACDICSRFAAWFVYDPATSFDPALADDPVCTVLRGAPPIAFHADVGEDRAALASAWCLHAGASDDRCSLSDIERADASARCLDGDPGNDAQLDHCGNDLCNCCI